MIKECPACGEKMINSSDVFIAVYGQTQVSSQQIPTVTCPNCGAEFYADDNRSDKIIKDTMLQAKQQSVIDNLHTLEQTYSLTEIERCLSLPTRTLSKWKNKSIKPSASSVALINVLTVFPWLLDIAVCNYHPVKSYQIAIKEIINRLKDSNDNLSVFGITNNSYDVIGLVNSKSSIQTLKSDINTIDDRNLKGANYVN